ncbi:MAG: ion channel [Casimicrobiaceae bacterium]
MDQWRPVWEIALGAGALVTSLMVHGAGMFWIQRRNVHYRMLAPLHWRREAAFSFLILLMLMTHVIEVLLWSVALTSTGALASFRDAYYYVAVTYTTLGYAESTLEPPWRILAPMIAMSGVFAFGWTTSVLFSIVGDSGASSAAAAAAAAAAQADLDKAAKTSRR